ncbi:MAG TPA: dTDP-4-amino-4,6-dideoxygalactose transaminase [Verrucomicrobiae bacterium]|nr:dTDP-4-amino-4,6-dideoxygalactose transaminase [Verrucomicrobiae bacterium]
MSNRLASAQLKRIPFNRPYSTGREFDFIREAIEGGHISGDGRFSRQCQALLESITGCHRVLLTTSCTDALEMTALLLNLQPGDEVIVPSFTFVSGANAYSLRGARIVFADIRQDTLNLDETQLDARINARTRAILAVHYAGVGCEMDAILASASRHGIAVIEDNAHGLFGRYRGRNLGTFGQMATLSFHETKNVSCGEGGALLLNDPALVERAEILREKGTNRSRFFRGLVDKYTWVDLGSSFLPSDVLAAFLYAQLEARDSIQAARKRVWSTYAEGLRDWAAANGVRLPVIPSHCEQPYHMFYLILPTAASRDALISHLGDRGMLAVFHYLPLHLSEMGIQRGGRPGQCPVTEDLSARLIRLPFYNGFAESDQARVIDAVLEFRP